MSRQIRRVPANWQHPKAHLYGRFDYVPMLDQHFDDAMAEWQAEKTKWDAGERPDHFDPQSDADYSFEEYHGEPPTPEYYRPYRDDERVWWQMYQTVSEGTPVTPAFATPEELIDYLVEHGEDYGDGTGSGPWMRERAEKFVRDEQWFPSAVFCDGQEFTAKEGWPK